MSKLIMPTRPKVSTLSLRLKVIFSIILILTLIGGTFSFLTVRSIHVLIEEVMWENYSSYSRSFASFSAKSFVDGDMAELQRHLDIAFAEQEMIFVVAKGNDGRIVATVGDLTGHEPFRIQKDVFADENVMVQEIGHEPGGLFHAAGHTFLITTQIFYQGQKFGTVQLAVNTASANQRLANISFLGFGMAMTIIAAGTFSLIFVDRRLKKHISRLIQIARQMANGDLSQRVEIKTGDEIEHLGESFNMMAEAIKTHEKQLEHLVELRTVELASEKNKLQLILDNVPSAFLMLDKELRVESVSSQFESVFSKSRADILGQERALSHILYQDAGKCPSLLAFESGKVQSAEARITDSERNEKFLEHLSIPIKRNGRVERVLEIITDITSRKRFEEQLIRTEKLSATGEMAAIIAHEIRNSLSSVNLILQCMTDSTDRAEEEAESLEVAIESVNRMETIVSQLLAFAKPGEIKFQVTDINEFIKLGLEFCRYQIQRKSVRLITDFEDGMPLLEVDMEMMREVFVNLVLNAVDAVGEQGTIAIKTRLRTLNRLISDQYQNRSVTLRKGQKVLEVTVTDNGKGIASESLPRVFDPFFTTKTNGTGLGLTMAKRAVNEHAGILEILSTVDQGSTFTILLPLTQPAEQIFSGEKSSV